MAIPSSSPEAPKPGPDGLFPARKVTKTPEELEVQRQIRRLLTTVSFAIAAFASLTLSPYVFGTHPYVTAASLLAFPCAISIVAYAVVDSLCCLLTLEGGLQSIKPSKEFWTILAAGSVAAWMVGLSVRVRNRAEWDAIRGELGW